MNTGSLIKGKMAIWIVEVIALLLFCFFLGAIGVINVINTRNQTGVSLFPQEWVSVQQPVEGIVLKNTVPEDLSDGMYLMMRSHLQTVEIYVDGQQVYEYPNMDYFMDMVPSNWNMVRMPYHAAGKEIEIRLASRYQGFGSKTSEIYYGYYKCLTSYISCCQIPWFILSLMIGIIGTIVVVISLVLRRYYVFLQQEFLGIVLIFLSFWMCGESKMPLHYVRQDIQHFITMTSLNFIPVFVMALCYLRNCNRRTFINYIFIAVSAICTVCFVIAQTHVSYLVNTLYVIHFLIFVAMICMLCVILDDKKEEKFRYINSEILCVILLLFSVCMEILLFYMGKSRTIGIYIRIAVLIYAVNMMVTGCNRMFHTILEKMELEKELQLSRAQLMTSQIQPHFIYNTLHSIQALIKCDPEEAYRMVQHFSTYLRAELSLMNEQTVIPFSQELRHIRAYTEIEQIRFGERLQLVYDIETTDFVVPPLSVQPLVENAIKHGICRKIQGGTVWVKSRKTETGQEIEILDDGVGFDTADLPDEKSDSYGIRNIRYRVEQICGGELMIESCPGKGCRVLLKIPGEDFQEGEK